MEGRSSFQKSFITFFADFNKANGLLLHEKTVRNENGKIFYQHALALPEFS